MKTKTSSRRPKRSRRRETRVWGANHGTCVVCVCVLTLVECGVWRQVIVFDFIFLAFFAAPAHFTGESTMEAGGMCGWGWAHVNAYVYVDVDVDVRIWSCLFPYHRNVSFSFSFLARNWLVSANRGICRRHKLDFLLDFLAFYGCLRNCLDFIIIISIIISTIIIIIIIIFIKSASNNLKVNRLEIIANGTRCVVTIIRYPAQGQQSLDASRIRFRHFRKFYSKPSSLLSGEGRNVDSQHTHVTVANLWALSVHF